MSSYFNSYKKEDCNGCGICELKCPQKAISMQEDAEGFLYPVIDKQKCNKCGLCKKLCSNNPNKGKSIQTYVAINNDLSNRLNSTSGGIFSLLVKQIIEKNGVVFGVTFDKNLNVKHEHYNTLDKCKKFSGSKYVRSDLNNSFNEVLKFLNEDKYVLFSGTPCQCYALRKFLVKDYDKLLICDVFCHSNPSPKVFEMYKNGIEKKFNKKIKNIYFRGNKSLNIKQPYVEFEDKSTYNIKLWHETFISMLISRPSCSSCNFRSLNRHSDITLGDYWGYKKFISEFDIKNGVSLVSINTKKGEMFFDLIKADITYKKVDMIRDYKYNFTKQKKMHKNRDKFFNKLEKGIINDSKIIEEMKKNRKSLLRKILIIIKKNITNYTDSIIK